MQNLDKRFIRFIIIGVSNTIVSYMAFWLMYYIINPGSAILSQPVSYGVGICWSYLWNRKWTFQSNAKVGREFTWFIAVQLFLLILSTVLLHLLVVHGIAGGSVSWIIVMTFITLLNYKLTKRIVFK